MFRNMFKENKTNKEREREKADVYVLSIKPQTKQITTLCRVSNNQKMKQYR